MQKGVRAKKANGMQAAQGSTTEGCAQTVETQSELSNRYPLQQLKRSLNSQTDIRYNS
jgi:hypothetical protein